MKTTRRQLKKLILQEMSTRVYRGKPPHRHEMLNYIKEYLIKEFGHHPSVVDIGIKDKHSSVYIWLSNQRRQGIRIIYNRLYETLDLYSDYREPSDGLLDINDDAVFRKLRNYIHDILEWKA